VLRKSKLEEEGAILEEKLEAINEELENVENELERDENLTDTISTNLKEFVRSSEKALKGFQKLFFRRNKTVQIWRKTG
jgi:sugar-specific transcriptional regulator TrmB